MSAVALHVPITAIGMVTSVGYDHRTACAAIRAGLARPSPLHEHRVSSLVAPETLPLIGHPVVPITNGFVGFGRWLQLARCAMQDLLPQLDPKLPSNLYISLPDLDSPRFTYDEELRADKLDAGLLAPLRAMLPNAAIAQVLVRPSGRVGLAQLLAEVDAALGQGLQQAIVLAVDAHVDPFAVMWLDELERVKSGRNPVGLMPGEAGVAIACSRAPAAMVRVSAVERVEAPTDDTPAGREIGQALGGLVDEHTHDLYSDHNGEAERAALEGMVLAAMPPQSSARLQVHRPSASIGDPGEVSALVHVGVAAWGVATRRVRGRAVVLACDDADDAACFKIERLNDG